MRSYRITAINFWKSNIDKFFVTLLLSVNLSQFFWYYFAFRYLQNIPQFLPVMRGTVSLPANRDPEVLERLHPENMCNRMEVHLNASAAHVGNEQAHITAKLKEVGFDLSNEST